MMRGYGLGYDMMGGGWVGGALFLLFGTLVVVGVVLLVIWAVRASSGHTGSGGQAPPAGPAHDEAVAVARRRLASGEINRDQYEEIMRALGS